MVALAAMLKIYFLYIHIESWSECFRALDKILVQGVFYPLL